MNVGVVIPFRGLYSAKSRLRALLPAATVEALSKAMLANVVRAVRGALPEAPIALVTGTRSGLSPQLGVAVLEQSLDQNAAIEFARADLERRGLARLLVLSSDLPLIAPADVAALLAQSGDVVLAPDEQRQGTNALVCPIAEAGFFQFGAQSARLHAAEASRRALSVAYVHAPWLARDIDTADQIDDAVLAACASSMVRD